MVFITCYDFGLGYCVSSNLRENNAATLCGGQKVLHSFRKIGTLKLDNKFILPNIFLNFFLFSSLT
jgi:hypothetical protein